MPKGKGYSGSHKAQRKSTHQSSGGMTPRMARRMQGQKRMRRGR